MLIAAHRSHVVDWRIKHWIWQCRSHWWLWKEPVFWSRGEKKLIAGNSSEKCWKRNCGQCNFSCGYKSTRFPIPTRSPGLWTESKGEGKPRRLWRSFSDVSGVLLSPEGEGRKLRGKSKVTLTYQATFLDFFSEKRLNYKLDNKRSEFWLADTLSNLAFYLPRLPPATFSLLCSPIPPSLSLSPFSSCSIQ